MLEINSRSKLVLGKGVKARYFPHCDFFSAAKGYRASWSWSSLLEARDIISSGARWQLGNGLSIHMWGDKWLPPPYEGTILPISSVHHNAPSLVYQLIDWHQNSWNLFPISNFISPDVMKLITLIPIGDITDPDRLIWPWNLNGAYFVKSGYHWHHSRKRQCLPCSSNHSYQVSLSCWKVIWSMKVIPKIKTFFWRALSNAIPSFLNLYRRKIKNDPTCPICNSFKESMKRALLLCPWTEVIWFGSPLGLRIDKSRITTLDLWIMDIHKASSSSCISSGFLPLVGFICWSIWKSRCAYIYQGTGLSPAKTISQATSSLLDFNEALSPYSSDVDPPL